MRILVLSPYLPHQRVGHGGGVAVRELLRFLARRHEVVLACLIRPGEEDLQAEVAQLGVRLEPLLFLDRRSRGTDKLRLIASRGQAVARAVASGYPLYVEKYWSPALARRLRQTVAAFQPDAVQIEYLQMALYCQDLKRWRERQAGRGSGSLPPRLVLNSHELGSLPRFRRSRQSRHHAERLWHRRAALAWERLQRDATTWADTTLCVTDQDRRLLEKQGGVNCRTMPLGVNTESIQPVWDPLLPLRFLFVGSFAHRPNFTGAKLLVDKVWPQVAKYFPDATLVLAGRGSRAFFRARPSPPERVEALGFVEDLTALYRECHLFVAPLSEGGGIKIKILEAMAHGIPVVTTPIGAEGIVDPAEDAFVIAEPDATFAESMIQALEAPEESRCRAERARRIIEERFSWSAITERLTFIYEGR